ncbi:MAG: hypothetical protein GXP26_06530 [Planctomycetes bacterium]|nr:hypothetical protein [Planctomycetota bacterium]
MKKFNSGFQLLSVLVLGFGLITFGGCGKSEQASTSAPKDDHAHDDGHEHGDGHDHPSEGPHHGGLVELGNEEFHAEVVHDEEAETVTIYLLDSAAKSAVPIEATELVVNLSHDGEAEQFKLAASPEPSDPQGKSSKFVSSDAELAEDLDHEGAKARLVVTIEGKQYHGEIHHDHDGHDDHDH